MSDHDKIQAVQKVLYERTRVGKLFDHLASIDALMNLDRTAPPLKTTDPRVQAGAGPTWVIQHTGKLDASVIESADRCDQIPLAEQLIEVKSPHVVKRASSVLPPERGTSRPAAAPIATRPPEEFP